MKKTKDDQNIGRDKESTMFCCTVVICSKDVSCHYNLVYYCMRICAFFERKKKPYGGFVTHVSLFFFFFLVMCPYNGEDGCHYFF